MKMSMIHRITLANTFKLLWAFWSLSLRLKSEEHLLPKTPFELWLQFLSGLSVVNVSV